MRGVLKKVRVMYQCSKHQILTSLVVGDCPYEDWLFDNRQ